MLTIAEPDLRIAADALNAGKLVALPTETVYGLGANAYDAAALARVFAAKRRPAFDPLIIHIADTATIDLLCDRERLAPRAQNALEALAALLWPGPLTLILPKRALVPDLATSGLPTVAVRFPSHPVARRLIELSSGAVAAPSANPFGYLSPTRAAHVAAQLGDRVDFIVDGGPCAVGVESTVLDLTAGAPTVLRPGGMELARIEAVVGPVTVFDRSVAVPTAPGQLASHYAPRTPLYLYEHGALTRGSGPRPSADEAVLCFDAAARERIGGGWGRVACLTDGSGRDADDEKAELIAAAAALFELLHELDAAGFAAIRAEKVPNIGLGPAVNDRLFKASVKPVDATAAPANPR